MMVGRRGDEVNGKGRGSARVNSRSMSAVVDRTSCARLPPLPSQGDATRHITWRRQIRAVEESDLRGTGIKRRGAD